MTAEKTQADRIARIVEAVATEREFQDHYKQVKRRVSKEFGKRLRIARRAAGYRQEDLGDALGLTRSSVSTWEKGYCFPNQKHVEQACELLDISVDWLIKGKGKPPSVKRDDPIVSKYYRTRRYQHVLRLIGTGMWDGVLRELGYEKRDPSRSKPTNE